MFGLLGPNGAGKSTLMRTLATLAGRRPRLGPAKSMPCKAHATSTCCATRPRVRRVLGYLPQDFGVYPKVNAEDMLDHLARLKGLVGSSAERRSAVETGLLRQTNLFTTCARKRSAAFPAACGSASASPRRLLGNGRKLIIVDEPTAGLDPEERTRFHNLLVEIGEEVIVLLSTHIVSDVSDLCPKLAIMNKGRVLVTGTPQQLTARLAGRVWATSVPRAEGRSASNMATPKPGAVSAS